MQLRGGPFHLLVSIQVGWHANEQATFRNSVTLLTHVASASRLRLLQHAGKACKPSHHDGYSWAVLCCQSRLSPCLSIQRQAQLLYAQAAQQGSGQH